MGNSREDDTYAWAASGDAANALTDVSNSNNPQLTHVGKDGRARMVDVSDKPTTQRIARAYGKVLMNDAALEAVRSGGGRKGDVLAVAQLAGIMAAKRTADLIPLCHQVPLSSVEVELGIVDDGVTVRSCCRTCNRTGVEMEALTAVSVACLTVYDMLKAVDRGMTITDVCMTMKDGGASGWMLRDDI